MNKPKLNEKEILIDSEDIKGDKIYLPDTDRNHWNKKKNRFVQRNTALDCRIVYFIYFYIFIYKVLEMWIARSSSRYINYIFNSYFR